ncbi:hypothetical protein NKJ64_29835, partial [Mesorhizobium sp. M0062]
MQPPATRVSRPNNEHSPALLWSAQTQRALNAPQAVAIQQQLSEIGNSGGRVHMQRGADAISGPVALAVIDQAGTVGRLDQPRHPNLQHSSLSRGQ